MADKTEGDLAGKYPDMGIKTIEGQDNEGHIKGSKEAEFDPASTRQQRREEDHSELNKKDDRGELNDAGSVTT